MTAWPTPFVDVLEAGAFCHVAAPTARGPHLTPLVFAPSDDRLWITTSRGSVKARAWRADPRVAGVVRDGERSVAFAGTATTYDALDPDTWERGLVRSPALARATVRFTRRNARFFAGYAVDARHVPLSWTPPGRVFVEIEVERAVLVRGDAVDEAFGVREPGHVASRKAFRRVAAGPDPFDPLPSDLGGDLSFEPDGMLALDDGERTVVTPARWSADAGTLAVSVPREVVAAMAGARAEGRAALVVERPSWWRARRMTGAMLQGSADVFDARAIGSGSRSVRDRIARTGADPDRSVLVRLRPERVVWWRGWESGSRRVS